MDSSGVVCKLKKKNIYQSIIIRGTCSIIITEIWYFK
jgi:hypothetical protein